MIEGLGLTLSLSLHQLSIHPSDQVHHSILYIYFGTARVKKGEKLPFYISRDNVNTFSRHLHPAAEPRAMLRPAGG